MSVNINKLSKKQRDDLNYFLKTFIEQSIIRHTDFGKDFVSQDNDKSFHKDLPDNLQIYENNKFYNTLDLAHRFQEAFRNFKYLRRNCYTYLITYCLAWKF